MKTLKIANNLVVGLIKFLNSLDLEGNKSRQRTRFIKLLIERAQEIEKIKKEIIEKYAKKDKDGKVIMTQMENNQTSYEFENDNLEEANKELGEYLKEELIVDILEERKTEIETMKDLILNTEKKFSEADAVMYNDWCEAFEKI